MTDPAENLLTNLDTEAVCRCPYCTQRGAIHLRRNQSRWPDWAAPSTDWRPVEVVKVSGGRL